MKTHGLNKKLIPLTIICGFLFNSCNHNRFCIQPVFFNIILRDFIGEPYGATDINAITGNRALTVALNEKGTITVFKWPTPSFYDHLKYMTTTRSKERLGALENEGIFSGIYYETKNKTGFFWLRDIKSEQRYFNESSVVVITNFRESELGLDIEQVDFVEPEQDIFWRHYRVKKSGCSELEKLRIIFYLNFAPVVSKYAFLPIRDWCLDGVGSSTLIWEKEKEIFIQFKEGMDHSTRNHTSVYIAFGLDGKAKSHQAGLDNFSSCKKNPKKKDPFYLARKGNLKNSDYARGQVSAGLVQELEFDQNNISSSTLLVSVSDSKEDAISLIQNAREKGFEKAFSETEKSWEKLLKNVPVPDTGDSRIKEVAIRSVIVLLLGHSKETGSGVASISTQPPYGLDWQRDGAFTNYALMSAGFEELAKRRNLFWAKFQSQPENKIPFVPYGNWASNYYADGVPGFPFIFWEIDETGWALWSIASYYQASLDKDFLYEVYPAVKRSADFLSEFKDPHTGLHKKAYEDDNPYPRSTLHGAVPVYLGLKSASFLAEAMQDEDSRKRWQKREEELKRAILERFYDPLCKRFVGVEKDKGKCYKESGGNDPALLVWPARMLEPDDPRADQALEQVYKSISKSFRGETKRGLYETLGLLPLAVCWKDKPEKLKLIKQGLAWEARVPITPTGHIGEVWMEVGGKIIPGQSQPQLWHHALFYTSSIYAFGAKDD